MCTRCQTVTMSGSRCAALAWTNTQKESASILSSPQRPIAKVSASPLRTESSRTAADGSGWNRRRAVAHALRSIYQRTEALTLPRRRDKKAHTPVDVRALVVSGLRFGLPGRGLARRHLELSGYTAYVPRTTLKQRV